MLAQIAPVFKVQVKYLPVVLSCDYKMHLVYSLATKVSPSSSLNAEFYKSTATLRNDSKYARSTRKIELLSIPLVYIMYVAMFTLSLSRPSPSPTGIPYATCLRSHSGSSASHVWWLLANGVGAEHAHHRHAHPASGERESEWTY